MFFCTCAECGIKKTKFVKEQTGERILEPITAGVNIGQKCAETLQLFPQTKKTSKRYWSGDIAKGAIKTKDRLFSKSFGAPGHYWTWRKDGLLYKIDLNKLMMNSVLFIHQHR